MEKKDCVLVAFTFQGRVEIFGKSLEEVFQLHRKAIEKANRPDLKAIEMGRYVIFMLEQWRNFGNHSLERRRIIADLLNYAVTTLQEDGRRNYRESPILK
ncbi:hypothetical protein, partial [Odoribacter laneus]